MLHGRYPVLGEVHSPLPESLEFFHAEDVLGMYPAGQLDFLDLPYHQAIMRDEIPLSIGSGIGQSRTMMLLLGKAHLGEVSVSVWPEILKRTCAERHIDVLE